MTAQSEDDEPSRVVRIRAPDGIRIAARIFGPPNPGRLSVLCLAGLSRNSCDFQKLAEWLAIDCREPRRVVALDMRGRGFSDSDPDWRNYTPPVEANDTLAAAAALGIERAVVVGTSRGGILAMMIAAARPGLLAGVVLNDIGPVIEGTGLARIKAYLSATRRMADLDEAAAAAKQAAGATFPGLSEGDWAAYARAFYFPDGPARSGNGLVPAFDRNLLKAVQAIDLSQPIPKAWPLFDALGRVPVLAIRGEHSDILSHRTLVAMAERHPQFEQLTIPGQGHAPLLRDRLTLERIAAFVRRCEIPAHE